MTECARSVLGVVTAFLLNPTQPPVSQQEHVVGPDLLVHLRHLTEESCRTFQHRQAGNRAIARRATSSTSASWWPARLRRGLERFYEAFRVELGANARAAGAMLPVLSKWKLANHHRVAQVTEEVDNVRHAITITRVTLLEQDHRLRQLQADRYANPVMIAGVERDQERIKSELIQLGGEAA